MTHHVYIMTNRRKKALFCGVCENLNRRVRAHRARRTTQIAPMRHLTHLLWVETFEDLTEAENRQAEIRKMSRKKKDALIDADNPDWVCLAAQARIAAGRSTKPYDWRKHSKSAKTEYGLKDKDDISNELIDFS